MSNKSTVSIDLRFFWLVALVFTVLKLTGYIDWSWWWVLSPIWIGFLYAVVLLGLVIAFMAWRSK